MDRQTDMMKLIVTCCSFVNTLKNDTHMDLWGQNSTITTVLYDFEVMLVLGSLINNQLFFWCSS